MIPEVNITIVDGGLGLIPASVANTSVKIGVCSEGLPNAFYSFGDLTTLENTLGGGPLVEAIADTLGVAGAPVYAVPATPSTAGTASATTHTGTGVGTCTGTPAPDRQILMKVVVGGTRGVATVAFSVGGGAYGAPVLTAATLQVAGTLVTIAVAAQTYTADDVWTITTISGITVAGSGTAGWITISSASPVDAYDVIVQIVAGGAPGTGTFRYSVDGGNAFSGTISIPTGFKYAIVGAGIYLTFSNSTFVADDDYEFTTTASSYSTSDATAALTVLLADSREWGFVHMVGAPSSAANAATLAGVVDTSMTTAQTNFRYVFAVIECPSTESQATVIAAWASFASTRIMVCAGDIGHSSPISGRILRRNCAWVVTSRIAGIRVGKDPAAVGLGRVPNVISLYYNEATTPGFDNARLTTMRTFIGFAGYYITNGNMMAPGGSDFTLVQYRRVMDRACQVVRAAEIPMLSEEVRIDLKTGYIDERDAQAFEAKVGTQLKTALVATNNASDAEVVVSRTTNLLSSSAEPVTVRIVPLAYLKEIDNTIGFSNPALSA